MLHHRPHDRDLQQLLSSLEELQSYYTVAKKNEINFVQSLLSTKEFQALIKVHQTLTYRNPTIRHVTTNSYRIAAEAYDDLIDRTLTSNVREVLDILLNPFIKALFDTHDDVANKNYVPQLPDIPYEVDEGETSIKIVRLVKNNEPLGATICLDDITGAIYVARIMSGGAADRSGLIHVGDELWEVNGIDVRGMEPDDIVRILASVTGPITFKLVPGDLSNQLFRESMVKVRAHFNYDPRNDPLIPCPEAALSFKRGDVLHIVCQSDPEWWQARRDGDKNLRAGLIPSRILQERRVVASRNKREGTVSPSSESQGHAKCRGSPKSQKSLGSPVNNKKVKKGKKIMYELKRNEEYDRDEIITYEEVDKYYPNQDKYRLILLVGAPGIGRSELKRRLLVSNPGHFESTIPHTSRPPKANEENGRDYFFVSREEMDANVRKNLFVEYGEYKGNIYGTSLQCVRDAMNAGKVCVLTPHPKSLKLLRNGELKPYVIFIKAPSIEALRATRLTSDVPIVVDDSGQRAFTDEELHTLIDQSQQIYTTYGHYCDDVITNGDLSTALSDLSMIVSRIEHEVQWVPASWVR